MSVAVIKILKIKNFTALFYYFICMDIIFPIAYYCLGHKFNFISNCLPNVQCQEWGKTIFFCFLDKKYKCKRFKIICLVFIENSSF